MFTKRPKITNYFEDNLIPAFKNHGSIWVLKAGGIPSAELGITNNPSESMNAVLHHLQKWKNVPLDVMLLACTIYVFLSKRTYTFHSSSVVSLLSRINLVIIK